MSISSAFSTPSASSVSSVSSASSEPAASGRPELLLVHGAWHGSWCWEKVRAALAARGRHVRTVDLPSAVSEESSGRLPGVADDARVVREAIDGVDGPVVVVAHSYGGIPVTEATAGAANVTHIVYLTAFQLDIGESAFSFLGIPHADPDSVEGTYPVPENGSDTFYRDVPKTVRDEALARLVPQSARSFTEPVTRAGWHTLPSTYIVCDDDRSLSPSHQERMAERAGTVRHLPGGHSPFLAAPEELATLLAEIAGPVAPFTGSQPEA
ncbi:alpha/beta hydrolase [Streptomyces sp. SCA3-4]|uniref:alpha/beta hydrolase n=1 Tax=Streptomyces sichuanensis TaxID=2871810 RepID=UPI001CE314E4|nr:alpha/beta hydrolase [Streptomyces sichuanensis]MCA6094823.1 alpha/beta hydrolase [Streptomyces sichuanensis]